MTDLTRRALRILGLTLLVYGVLVATNEGEFWPFSIFPMFSQAGNPWSRSVVRDVPVEAAARWDTLGVDALPGRGFPLLDHGVDPIDLANFITKTNRWTEARAAALQQMLAPAADTRLQVFRADGRTDEEDGINVVFVPMASVTADSVVLNPALLR